jgi:replicative DNA helicase
MAQGNINKKFNRKKGTKMNIVILLQVLYDEDAERAIISSLIVHPEDIDLLHRIDKFDFYLEKHRIIFDVIKKFYNKEKQISIILLKNKLEVIGKPSYVGRIQFKL